MQCVTKVAPFDSMSSSKFTFCTEFCGGSGTSSRGDHLQTCSNTPFPATLVSRRRRGQKSPSAGRRRRPAGNTPRCGAKLPMGCTSSAVTMPAAGSSALWRGKGGESLNPKTAGAVLRLLEGPAFLRPPGRREDGGW